MQLPVQIRGLDFPFLPHPQQFICAVSVPEPCLLREDWQRVKEGDVAPVPKLEVRNEFVRSFCQDPA